MRLSSVRFAFFFLFLFVVHTVAGLPLAHASFGIMPMEAQVKMPKSGTQATNEIEVYNGSAEPLFITGSIVSWNLTPQGDYEYSPDVNQPQSCASWIKLNPEQFIVPAKKSVHIRYTITPPVAFTNEHRAMIFFQSRPVPQKSGGITLNIAMRVGCKIFVQPAQASVNQARISDMKFEKATQQRLQVTVENTGRATCRAGGKVEILDAQGTLITTGALQPKTVQILPASTRYLNFVLDKPLPVGEYRIKAVVDYGAKQLLGGELTTKIDGS